MSFKMTVMVIFWIVVVVVIAADLIYMLAKTNKNKAISADVEVGTSDAPMTEEVTKNNNL